MKSVSLAACLIIASALAGAQETVNPNFIYFTQGQTPGNWQWVLADPGNWWQPIPDSGGESANGKVTLSSAEDKQFPGAVALKWSRSSDWGSAALSGGMLDLSKFEHAAELVVALKVASKVPDTVKVKMACGEGCEAEVNIADNLKQGPRDQWFALPLALDCFTANGLNLSKVNWPFSIGTAGALELQIAEISLAPIAEGEQGCVPDGE